MVGEQRGHWTGQVTSADSYLLSRNDARPLGGPRVAPGPVAGRNEQERGCGSMTGWFDQSEGGELRRRPVTLMFD